MKRTTIILIAFLLLLLGLFFFLRKDEHESTMSLKEQMTFKVENIDQVHKIFIANREEKPLQLTREGDRWRLDDEFNVNPFVMEGILDVIQNVRVQFIPSEVQVDNQVPFLASRGIKVEIYDKDDNELMSYYIGGVTQTEKGTHFYKEGGEKTYVMEMPYGETNIRQRFDIDYDAWKSRLIFKDKVENIVSVKVDYPRSPSHGFKIINNSGEFELTPSVDDQPAIERPLKPSIFERYLIGFRGVSYAGYTNKVTAKDSILAMVPFMTTELVNTDDDTFKLTLWPKTQILATPIQAQQVDGSMIGYHALNERGDFGSVQHMVVRNTIASYAGFFK